VLFLDTVHPVLAERLEHAGMACSWLTKESPDEIDSELRSAFGIVIRSRFLLDEHLLTRCPNLRFIARSGSGLENIDISAATKRGIQVFNSPEGNKTAVAEHAIGMMLMLLNNLCRADRQIRNGKWIREGNRGGELDGKCIGIIGYGNTGSAFASRIAAFGCRVLAYDKYKKNFANDFVREATLEDIYREADVLSLHLPLTQETHYWLDVNRISLFTKPFLLVNTARGAIVNTADLANALRQGSITGACLDVFEYEDVSFEALGSGEKAPAALQFLLSSDKVVLTPHVAGWTQESYFKLSAILADKILDWYHRKAN